MMTLSLFQHVTDVIDNLQKFVLMLLIKFNMYFDISYISYLSAFTHSQVLPNIKQEKISPGAKICLCHSQTEKKNQNSSFNLML